MHFEPEFTILLYTYFYFVENRFYRWKLITFLVYSKRHTITVLLTSWSFITTMLFAIKVYVQTRYGNNINLKGLKQ